MMKISIIIPTLNEIDQIGDCLNSLQSMRQHGHEIIVVDGGSDDGTPDRIGARADLIVHTAPGRALQMNCAARAASGGLLLFLHADTRLDMDFDIALRHAARSDREWGRFNVRLSGSKFFYRVIGSCMNLRSRLTGIATGDQAIFVTRQLFDDAGGYSDIELMEDIDLSRRLRKMSWPITIDQYVMTSSRRWDTGGIVRTIFKMWSLRLRFAFGACPADLARRYG